MTTTTTNTKYFYAKSYRFGKNAVSADTGCEISTVLAFRCAADRDAWVSASTQGRNESNYRCAAMARACSPRDRADAQMMMEEQYEDRERITREFTEAGWAAVTARRHALIRA